MGAIFNPLNWRLTARELANAVGVSTPKVLFSDTQLGCELPGTNEIVFDDVQEGIDQLIEGRLSSETAFVSDSDERVLTLLFTSGTTGQPKAVPYTERMVMCSVVHAAAHGMTDGKTRSLVLAPLFHSAGLFAGTTPAFHFGGSVAVDNVWDPAKCLALLSEKSLGISHFNGVPTIFKQLAELSEFESADLSHVKVLGIGSAPISRELLEKWECKGVALTQSYGLTEAFGVSITPADDAEHFIGSAGLPMIHSQIRLVANGKDVDAGEVGEIWVRGASVLPHYWGDSSRSKEAGFVDGWLRTGDLGMQDERGALFIVDRLKDMIISGGENIYPAEIEHLIAEHPSVRCVAVVGSPHEKWGEVPVAIIEPRDGHSLNMEELRDFCRDGLAGYKVPRHWFETTSIEHTAQGKVARQELREEVGKAIVGKQTKGALKPLRPSKASA